MVAQRRRRTGFAAPRRAAGACPRRGVRRARSATAPCISCHLKTGTGLRSSLAGALVWLAPGEHDHDRDVFAVNRMLDGMQFAQ